MIFLHLRLVQYLLFDKSIYFALLKFHDKKTSINKIVYFFPCYALYICENIFIWKLVMGFPEVCPNHIQIIFPFWWIWICLNNLGFVIHRFRKIKKSYEIKRINKSCPKLLILLEIKTYGLLNFYECPAYPFRKYVLFHRTVYFSKFYNKLEYLPTSWCICGKSTFLIKKYFFSH